MSMMTWESAQAVGLNEAEWKSLVERLERAPSHEELQMIAVMWSEHCSYKSTKPLLKTLITEGPSVLQGPGENAGLVRLDEKRALAFKVESHNHPSFVEPFQGAATGVGGILRDIFTMGARPIATGNLLRFGPLDRPRQRFLLDGVVSGISHYGNCVGVPTILGQIHTDPSYEHNCLVNVFCLGLVEGSRIFKSDTAVPGASVMLWGAKTGRDGIHGASLLASADFVSGKESASDDLRQKIRVQVGDPFKEKCLLEATLEAMRDLSDDLLAIQDMGAAGLTSSTMEISHKSRIGMRLNLDHVPVRERGLMAYELLLSESQERMLAIVKKGSEKKFEAILSRWSCDAAILGETTPDGFLKMSFQGEQVVNLPVSRMIDPPAPEFSSTEISSSDVSGLAEALTIQEMADTKDEWGASLRLLSEFRIASKSDVYTRYDSTVGAATLFGPGGESAVLWLGSEAHPHIGVGIKAAWDESYAKIDAKGAAHHAMAECARALACVGARPLGITDGVNLGNPQHSRVRQSLAAAIQGINEGIKIFDAPCVGGNVSLYNQTQWMEDGRAKTVDIDPTVFIVMVGRIEDVRKCVPSKFQKVGNEVWLLESPGCNQALPVGSLYARLQGWPTTELPWCDLHAERKLQQALLHAHEHELFVSCRDVSDGGLVVSLAESLFGDTPLGLDGDLSKSQHRRDFQLFGEAGGRVIVEIDPLRRAELVRFGMQFGIELKRIGQLTKEALFRIRPLMTGPVSQLQDAWSSALKVKS